MKLHKYILFLLIFLFVVYFLQGVLYEQGSIISQSALLFIYLLSGVYLIKSFWNKEKKSSLVKIWTFFLVLNIIYFVFYPYDPGYSIGMFKRVLMSFLSFYPFYYFSKTRVLKDRYLIYLFVVLLPVTVMSYYFNAQLSFAERDMYNENFTNNVVYSFVALIPFVFLFRKQRIISFLAVFLLMFFIVQGAKRGALIVGAVGFLIFIWYQLTLIEGKGRWRSYFIVFIGVIIIGYYAIDYYLQQEYLVRRMVAMTGGDSSGRDNIYRQIWQGWYNSDSLLHYIFGFGFGGSRYLTNGMFAHNDWLELLSNMGLVGFITYLVFFFIAFRNVLNRNISKDKRIMLLAILSMWFMTTLFSMGYMDINGYLRAVLIGYIIGSEKPYNVIY